MHCAEYHHLHRNYGTDQDSNQSNCSIHRRMWVPTNQAKHEGAGSSESALLRSMECTLKELMIGTEVRSPPPAECWYAKPDSPILWLSLWSDWLSPKDEVMFECFRTDIMQHKHPGRIYGDEPPHTISRVFLMAQHSIMLKSIPNICNKQKQQALLFMSLLSILQ